MYSLSGLGRLKFKDLEFRMIGSGVNEHRRLRSPEFHPQSESALKPKTRPLKPRNMIKGDLL